MDGIHPELKNRKIIHVDMDAFYASIEMREDPSLVSKPLGIGGDPNGRGVLCTANYVARGFGVKSAMPSRAAMKLCPDLVIRPPRFDLYKSVSRDIKAILGEFTDKIETIGLDEAYLDVTTKPETATSIAQQIRSKIKDRTQLTASAGVAPNKMLAKIASDLQKPDGITILKPHQIAEFIKNLPVTKIPGVGPVSAQRLKQLNILICSDIYKHRKLALYEAFGSRFSDWIWDRGMGIDKSEVSSNRIRKSISVEKTFAENMSDIQSIKNASSQLAKELSERLKLNNVSTSSISIKLKFIDFSQNTRALSPPFPIHSRLEIEKYTNHLLEKNGLKKPIRLLGIKASYLNDRSLTGDLVQPSLFEQKI